MSDPNSIRMTVSGYDVVVTRTADGGLSLQIDLGWLGWKTMVITGDEWRTLVAFQPVPRR